MKVQQINCSLLSAVQRSLVSDAGMSDWTQIGQNWDFLNISFQYILLLLILKSPRCVPFGANSDTPGQMSTIFHLDHQLRPRFGKIKKISQNVFVLNHIEKCMKEA